MEAAAEQLSKTLAWRKSFDVESVPTESFPEDVFGKVRLSSHETELV
jgi:hypothetical protein